MTSFPYNKKRVTLKGQNWAWIFITIDYRSLNGPDVSDGHVSSEIWIWWGNSDSQTHKK